MSNPLVYIIILNFNGKDVSAECLDSLAKVTYDNYKICIVDNGSSDDSVVLFKTRYPQHHLIETGKNLGFAGGNNLGIKYALEHGADYILLLNNDTVVDPHFLPYMVQEGESSPDIGVLNPRIYYMDSPDLLWWGGGSYSLWTGFPRNYLNKKKDSAKSERKRYITFATGCALMVKREVVEKVGLMDESFFLYSEDLDWSVTILKVSYRALYVPRAKIWHKEGVAALKSADEAFRLRLATRNTLRVHAKHSSWYHRITCYPWFMVRWVGWICFKKILQDKPKDALAVLQGAWDFVKNDLSFPGEPGAN